MIGRLTLLTVVVVAAGFASWLIPKLAEPPDRLSVAIALLEDGRADNAVHLFDTPSWRGVAQYRAGRYHRALGEFIRDKSIANYYNLGNAYARLHDWTGARAAYHKTLNLDPAHENARFNLDLVTRAEAREKQLKAMAEAVKKLGHARNSGAGEDAAQDQEDAKVKKGGSNPGAMKPTDKRAAVPGAGGRSGQPGDEKRAQSARSGTAESADDEDRPPQVDGDAGAAMILRESTQAAEILLRRILDDPARVLSARLRAAHRQRQRREGPCTGC